MLNFWTHHPSAQSQCSPAVFKPPVPLPPQTSRVCSGAHTWALLRHGSKRGHLLLLSVQHLTGRSLPLHMDYRLRLPPLPSPQSHSLLTFGAADHMVRRIGGIFFFTWPDALLFLAKPSALARHYPDYPVLTNIIDSWVLRVTVASMLMVINQRACVSAQGWTGARQRKFYLHNFSLSSLHFAILTYKHKGQHLFTELNMIHEIHRRGGSKRCITLTNRNREWKNVSAAAKQVRVIAGCPKGACLSPPH